VDELDEESNEAHYREADGGGNSNLLELFSVWLCAPFDQSDGVLAKLLEGLDCCYNLIHREKSSG